jgi:uncharacterized protein YndB with AHSA1/START domain
MGQYADFTRFADETGARLTDQPKLVEVTRHFDVSQQQLFDYIADFSRLSEWIWASKKSWADDSKAETPGQVGSVRMIQGAFGEPVREVVKAYEAPRMLAYSANDGALLGLCTDHLGVVTCEPHPSGGTIMCWQAYGRLARNSAKAFAGKKLFQVALTNGMKNLERKFPTR